MSASPLYRLTFAEHAPVELRGNVALWRKTYVDDRLVSLLVRDVIAGDVVRLAPLDPADPERPVTGVERLPWKRKPTSKTPPEKEPRT
jgi:hypothetical protein